jgi:hypothetical protein
MTIIKEERIGGQRLILGDCLKVMQMKLPVKITSNWPMSIEIDADRFGAIFAEMAADDQVATLAAMVEHMKPHQVQWDHISIELELPEHSNLRRTLRDVLFPEVL